MLFKALRADFSDKSFPWFIELLVCFFIKRVGYSEFLVNERLITFLILFRLNCLFNPFTELNMLSVSSRINTKLKIVLALPESFWI
jgi:hypothetical protein